MGNKLPQSIANAKQGQREQCSKHWIQLLLASKSNAISILPWLIPWLIVIGHQEQCSKYMKPLECSKHMKPRVQYQSYPG